MKTYMAKPEEVAQKWWIVDATGLTVGRLATVIAQKIRGKHKPEFTPHTDTGDFVIVVNSEKVTMTGNKLDQKKYYRHSRYFGGLKSFTGTQMIEKDPVYLLQEAVKGMLPKNKMGRHLLLKLKAYKGGEHPHASQKPEPLTLDN